MARECDEGVSTMPGEITVKNNVSLDIIMVGLGATGTHILRSLCQDLHFYKGKKRITLIDGDAVEEKNVQRQLFLADDLDKKKVHVLQDVYQGLYDVQIQSYADYIIDETVLERLVPPIEGVLTIVIAAVDNNQTRQMLDRFFKLEAYPDMVYIDAGIHGIEKNKDGKLDARTGNNGQVVVGFKSDHKIILEPLSAYYPNVMTDRDSPAPGCGEIVVSAPQRLGTNRFAAQVVNNIMATFIAEQKILVSHCTFDARMCGIRPTFVTIEQEESYKLRR